MRSAARPAAVLTSREVAADELVVPAAVLEGEPRVAGDGGEEIVEVVGDAARQQPERLEALRLAELLLECLALADVDDEALLGDRLARCVSHHRHVVEHPDDAAVRADHPVLAAHDVLREAACVQLCVDLPVVGMDERRREVRLGEPPLDRVAEEILRLPALEEGRCVEVLEAAHVGDERRLVDEPAMTLLGFAHPRLGLAPRLLEPDEEEPGEPSTTTNALSETVLSSMVLPTNGPRPFEVFSTQRSAPR